MKPSAARSFLLGLSVIALGGASAAALSGCHAEDCAEAQQCGSEPVPREAPGLECVADPSAGRAEDPCGVFVSASMGSDDNPGTRARPVRSMARAITLAQSGPSRVYACAETFAEPVVLPSGVELRGGLDCADDWAYVGGDRRTILAPGADAIPLRVSAGDGLSIVADIRAEAADAVQAGGSSIAAIVLPDAAVEILRSDLSAGNGAQGARGEDGGAEPAPVGMPGEAGANACIATTVQGGPAVEMTCGDMATFGGQGGQGGITAGTEGSDGQPEPVPNPQGWGLGGAGETSSAQCSPGEMGRDGLSADHGLGGSGLGRISAEGWQGANGQDGGHGLPGQGGGGGGGRRGGALLCGANLGNRGGAGGGSGGAGGCGGRGGTGGGFGGASIGLIALSADVVLRETSITAGNGGDGGTGGLLQPGGTGGVGGLGGAPFSAAPAGCQGGPGGSGGNGGNGGGGLGGASIGIAHLSSAPVTQEGVTLRMGQPGRGGPGGNPAVLGSSGADGPAAVLLPFEQ